MTQRLQILISDGEMERLRVSAAMSNVSVGEWVRQAIRKAFEVPREHPVETKLLAVREAVKTYAPTSDIDTMNREIESGYLDDLP